MLKAAEWTEYLFSSSPMRKVKTSPLQNPATSMFSAMEEMLCVAVIKLLKLESLVDKQCKLMKGLVGITLDFAVLRCRRRLDER